MRKSVVALLTSCLLAACGPTIRHERVEVEAPFAMEAISVPIYPARDFPITDYGASHEELCTEAIARAVEACNAAGGGRVVIPAGEWQTGPIHLKSNVNLHLAEGAVVRFTDNPADYLPAHAHVVVFYYLHTYVKKLKGVGIW